MTTNSQKHEVSDEELRSVIADFLEMGHVENIVAMFRHDSRYFSWSGELLMDERFNVRLGMSVLFEELSMDPNEPVHLAIPSLQKVLEAEDPLYRGEAVSILGMINTEAALKAVELLRNDPSPQVREMVELVLDEHT